MVLFLNIDVFKIRLCGVCSTKNKSNGASPTVQIDPTEYVVHPTIDI